MVINPTTIKLNKLSLACNDLTLKDLLEYSEKKTAGRIWIFFKLLIMGKGIAITNDIAKIGKQYFFQNQENEQIRAILDNNPNLKTFLRVHCVAIEKLENNEAKPNLPPILNEDEEQKDQIPQPEVAEVGLVYINRPDVPANEEMNAVEIRIPPRNQSEMLPVVAKEDFIRRYQSEGIIDKIIGQINEQTPFVSIEKALVLINVDCNQKIKKDKFFQGLEVENANTFKESLENIFTEIAEQVNDRVTQIEWSILFGIKNSNIINFAKGQKTSIRENTLSKWSDTQSIGTIRPEHLREGYADRARAGFAYQIRNMEREEKFQEWSRNFNL